jgi:hypothetical protein
MTTLIKNLTSYSEIDKKLAIHNIAIAYPGTWRIEGNTLIGEVSDSVAKQARQDGVFI